MFYNAEHSPQAPTQIILIGFLKSQGFRPVESDYYKELFALVNTLFQLPFRHPLSGLPGSLPSFLTEKGSLRINIFCLKAC